MVVGGEGGSGSFGLEGADLPDEATDRLPVAIDRPRVSPFQNGSSGGRLAGSRDHLDPVGSDVGDPPGAGPEDEHVARPAIRRPSLRRVRRPGCRPGGLTRNRPAVGDGPGVGDDQLAGTRAGLDVAAHPVPGDPGPQLGEEVGGITAGQHVEGGVEDRASEFGIGIGSADHVVQIVGGPRSMDDRRHDLLAEDVERISGNGGQLDVAFEHLLADHGRRQEVTPILREDPGPALASDLMAGAPDSLQTGGDRDRGFDLDHQIDRPHVDSEFERRGRDHCLEVSSLQSLLDQHPSARGTPIRGGSG